MSDDNNVLSNMLASKRLEMTNCGNLNWLIDLFINELHNYLNELQKALDSGEGEALFLAAHKFKGSCSNLGAVGMVALCKQLERLGHANDMEKAAIVMKTQVPKQAKLLREALEREKQPV